MLLNLCMTFYFIFLLKFLIDPFGLNSVFYVLEVMPFLRLLQNRYLLILGHARQIQVQVFTSMYLQRSCGGWG